MDQQKGAKEPTGLLKTPTGITEFDEITEGGLPRGRTCLVVGGPGSGKTVFALQTLVHGARLWGEPGIFVAFEENSRTITANAASFGWDLPALQEEKLFFLDARLSQETISAGRFDLAGMLAGLQAKATAMGAGRIVFDSMDVLLALLNDPVLERQEIYRVHDWLAQSGLTGIVTIRGEGPDPLLTARYGFVQFMADCVVHLSHRVEERISMRTLRVVKYRGTGFSENEFPLVIGKTGISVGMAHAPRAADEASTERVSTGIPRLDTMLQGGWYRGSSALISGAPGTAKSTLCGAFIEAACQRGERALFVSFDEGTSELMRNLASVHIHLEPYVKSGLLRIHSARAIGASAEEHLITLRALIDEQQPRCVAIDPLSSMIKAGGGLAAQTMADRLLGLTKAAGITLICTSLLQEGLPEAEGTPLHISTIIDTWIHLSFPVKAGERNRALTIVKSRGTGHSNQVRELILSDEGVTLADVYTAGGETLMGTLRWEKEEDARIEKLRVQAEQARRATELELAQVQAQARIEAIQRELAALRLEGELLETERRAVRTRWHDTRDRLLEMRSADAQRSGGEEQDSSASLSLDAESGAEPE
jgi:circadian clock protein KaiC